MMLRKIISGGQTGVDRAALDAALERGIPVGGFCPKGRRSEEGTIPDRYPLTETSSSNYAVRTEKNVIESDGTLVLHTGRVFGGTAYTVKMAERHKKPFLVVQLGKEPQSEAVLDCWLATNTIEILNVAGPRESEIPGIHRMALKFLRDQLVGETGRKQ
ncbi:MAG TPA: putative molybdenum carrier protein [Syntrophobacteraceae bacterium]|nr:putative molybdenum carrier protein [Syntrophobacteraceae bacterium]